METTIGTRMEKVPHDVPVENEIKTAATNRISGTRYTTPEERFKFAVTKSPMPSWSLTPFSVQASVRMSTAGIIIFAPSGRAPMKSRNEITLLGRYSTAQNRIVTIVEKIREISASQPANAATTLSAPPRKPV